MHTAITENRKTDNRLVLSFQGKSQLDKRYGQDAETILSQPFTKILLRTSEPRAAEWMSKAIGDIELERVRETRSNGFGSRHGRSYTHERKIEPLVLPAQIEGLNPLEGFLRLVVARSRGDHRGSGRRDRLFRGAGHERARPARETTGL